jgi:polyhydroxyalkanoate synthesis regulator phasin
MKGGFDLYGNYYPNANDALNAELSQCNEIDNRLNQKKLNDLERKLHEMHERQPYPSNEEEIHNLWEKIKQLEERIKLLESMGRYEK